MCDETAISIGYIDIISAAVGTLAILAFAVDLGRMLTANAATARQRSGPLRPVGGWGSDL